MLFKQHLKLYAITDRRWLKQNNYILEQAVEEAILGCATIIQLREKDIDYNDFLSEAINIKKITDKYDIPLIINDNIEVAINSNASGVHLGQEDIMKYKNDIKYIKNQLGKNKIIGVSANTLQEALTAELNYADYLGINTPFTKTKYSNNTKKDAKISTFNEMIKITSSVKIPCVAIGGIHKETIPMLKNTGICGVAMISEIFASKNIKQTTNQLLEIIDSVEF